MRELTRSRTFVAVLISITGALPMQVGLAQDGIQRRLPVQRVYDIALGRGGTLSGQIVDQSGAPLAAQRVIALQTDKEPIAVVSDKAGRFQFAGLGSGLYEISTERSQLACRCWTAAAAPPHAQRNIMLAAGRDVQRGQRPIGDFLGGPVLIGLIIAAAIAIPIAVHNSQKSAS